MMNTNLKASFGSALKAEANKAKAMVAEEDYDYYEYAEPNDKAAAKAGPKAAKANHANAQHGHYQYPNNWYSYNRMAPRFGVCTISDACNGSTCVT